MLIACVGLSLAHPARPSLAHRLPIAGTWHSASPTAAHGRHTSLEHTWHAFAGIAGHHWRIKSPSLAHCLCTPLAASSALRLLIACSHLAHTSLRTGSALDFARTLAPITLAPRLAQHTGPSHCSGSSSLSPVALARRVALASGPSHWLTLSHCESTLALRPSQNL